VVITYSVDSQGRRGGAWIPQADCEGCRRRVCAGEEMQK